MTARAGDAGRAAHAAARVPEDRAAPPAASRALAARPWVRGPFRREPPQPFVRGFAASVALHVVLGALAAVGVLDLSGAIEPPASLVAQFTTVEIELPRIEAVAQEAPPPPPADAVTAPAPSGFVVEPKGADGRGAPPPRAAAAPPPRAGAVGKAIAQREVVEQLASVTSALNEVVSSLPATLASTTAGATRIPASQMRGAASRAPAVRAARSSGEVGGADGAVALAAASGARAGASTGTLASGGLAIDGIIERSFSSALGGDGGAAVGPSGAGVAVAGGRAGGRGGARAGAAGADGVGGDARSNASLLAVVRRYAPGIQFCYDNELKKTPGLGGKLVATLTVAAAGDVTDAVIIQDSVGSPNLAVCALAQIRAWRFPQIPDGVVTFKTPFVFTPPE